MAEVQKPKDPAKIERRKARKVAKSGALDVLKELCDKQTDPKYKVALATLRPSLYGVKIGGAPSGNAGYVQFLKAVETAKSMTEDEVFKKFKLGRKDCAGFIRKGLKKMAPADRLWISFDAKNGVYKLEGKGEKAPKDWAGYVPVEGEVNLK